MVKGKKGRKTDSALHSAAELKGGREGGNVGVWESGSPFCHRRRLPVIADNRASGGREGVKVARKYLSGMDGSGAFFRAIAGIQRGKLRYCICLSYCLANDCLAVLHPQGDWTGFDS